MTLQTFSSKRSSFWTYCSVLILGFLLTSCDTDNGGGVSSTRYSATEEFSFQIEVANRTHLQVDAINGSIEIAGVSGTDTVRIWGERKVESESVADAEAHLQDLSVRIDEGTDKIIVQTEQPDDTQGRNYQIFYHILLPDNWQVAVGQANGNVTVSSISQNVDIEVSNGEVNIDSISGNANVLLANGTMRLWEISGSIDGNLANGRIDGKVFLPLLGTCQLTVANGQINLSIPDSTSAEFSANVANGRITITNLSLQNMVSSPTSVTGTLGDGEGLIELETANGNIATTGF